MRKVVLLSLVLLLGLVTGCGQEPASTSTATPVSPSPTSEASNGTSEPAADETDVPPTDAPAATSMPSEPAICEPFALPPAESRIPDVSEEDHVIGSDNAEITIIEYADFQCPACVRASGLRDYLLAKYGDRVRFVYRHLPLISIHDKALITAEAAEAAAAQGKFWEMHDLLYEKQQEWGGLSEEELIDRLVEYAGELELDTEQFETALTEHTYQDQIMADYEAYQEYGQMATPTYVVNKVFYPTRQLGGLGQLEPFMGLVPIRDKMYDSPPPQVTDADKDYVATIRTTKGDIKVELFSDQAPTNVNSFAFLAQDGWYDGLDFFFVDHEQMAASGYPMNLGGVLPYPGYHCSSEIMSDPPLDDAGLVALSNSTFFITYSSQPELLRELTVIGRIVDGMDVAESLTERQLGPDQPDADSIETIVIEEQ